MLVDIMISLITAFIIIALATLFVLWVIKTKVGKMAVVAAAAMLILFSVALASGHAEELRRVEVVDFDFFTAEVVLMDEDGYIWTCPFGTNSWSLGEEYELYLPDEGQPEIRELP